MREYTKIKITANALVPRGAVQEKAIFKDGEQRVELTDIVKSQEKQIMYSIMFPLNKADSQGCIVKRPEVLEEAAREFMKSGAKNLKIMHEGEFTDGAEIQELWIVKAGDPIFSRQDQIGALANAIYFPDAELFRKMKTEGWETSIEGLAEEIEVEKSEDGLLYRIAKKLKELIIKEEGAEMPMPTKEELQPLVEELLKPVMERIAALEEAAKSAEVETEIEESKPAVDEEKEEMKKTIEALKKSLEDVQKKQTAQIKTQPETKPAYKSFM